MPHISSKEILMDARRRRYGVVNVPASDIEMAAGFCKAAEEMQSPIILCFTSSVNPQIPMEIGIPMIVNAANRCSVPVATVLDHGHDMGDIVKAIGLGVNTVMYDGSSLPFDENIARTKEVVEYAHAREIVVEAELGSITGSSVEANYSSKEAVNTDPDLAIEFIERTGIDLLAISFGNAHGFYTGTPKLDLERVNIISERVDIPLVMHGGSGLSYDEYPKIIEAGISKINYYSAIARQAVNEIEMCMRSEGKSGYHDMVSCAVDSFYSQMKFLMRVFMSVGAAAGCMDELTKMLINETLEYPKIEN